MLNGLYKWLGAHEPILWWAGIVSAITFAATLVLVPILLARMRADYFRSGSDAPELWRNRHPALRAVGRVVKNLVGATFVVMGILMLVLPGQGVLTVLIGIALLDMPGKRALERRIVGQRHVRSAINWIRAKANRPPLLFDEPAIEAAQTEPP